MRAIVLGPDRADDSAERAARSLDMNILAPDASVRGQVTDRRVYDRVPADLAISAWSLSQPTRRLEGRTVNLSAGGALLHLPDLALLAATLQVSIDLPRERITVGAEVRWREDAGLVAVQFERISPESQAALVDYLCGHR